MRDLDEAALMRALDRLALRYRGPGGVAGVVREGRVVAARAWGFADLAARRPMTEATRLPICSISKQFTCGLLLDLVADPARLDGALARYLPQMTGPLPSVQQLCHNQSGLRDYWALTVLQGAFPEQSFSRADGLALLARNKTGHFAPGQSYSYSNGNFRLLAELIEAETGRDLAGLYAERIFGPAGMVTAGLFPDTRHPVDGVKGYEGNDHVGYLPADNGITWIGDAGLSASLADMLAWERHIDATRDDPTGLYNRLSAQPFFADGRPAAYGYGLKHDRIAGVATTGHGGALRGFRAHRIHAADERLSVVVMFNHEADAHGAAVWLMETALGHSAPPAPPMPADWAGLWLDEEQGLVLRTQAHAGALTLHYATTQSRLTLEEGQPRASGLSLVRGGSGLVMHRPAENLTVTPRPLQPLDWADPQDLAGAYACDELQAEMTIEVRGGVAHAGFTGMLGQGPMERLDPVARDIWILTTRRSMDSSPPGDWTLQIRRDDAGRVSGLRLGCWLARNLDYRRLSV